MIPVESLSRHMERIETPQRKVRVQLFQTQISVIVNKEKPPSPIPDVCFLCHNFHRDGQDKEAEPASGVKKDTS